jgi:hypothetical protein
MAIPYSNSQLQQMLATEQGQMQLLQTPGLTQSEVSQILQYATPTVRQQYQMMVTQQNLGRIAGVSPGTQLNTSVPGYSFPSMPNPGYVQDPFINPGAADRRQSAQDMLDRTDRTQAPLPTVNSPGYDPQTGYRQNPYTGQWEPPQQRSPENYPKAAFDERNGYNIPAANAAYQGLIKQGKSPEQARAEIDQKLGVGTAYASGVDQWRMAGEVLGEVQKTAPPRPATEQPLAGNQLAPAGPGQQGPPQARQQAGSTGGMSPAQQGSMAYSYAQGANTAPGGTGLAGAFLQGAQGGPGYGSYANAGYISEQMGNTPEQTELLNIMMQIQNLESGLSATNSWSTGRSRQNQTAQRIETQKQLDALRARAKVLQGGGPSAYVEPEKTMVKYDPRTNLTTTRTNATGQVVSSVAPTAPQTPQAASGPVYSTMPAYGAPAASQTPAVQSQQLATQYQTALDAANAANDARFQEAKTETLGLRDRTMAGISTLGDTQRRDINDGLTQAQANTTQSAINRGLYNTTILDSLQQGNQRTADRANQSLEESLNRQRIDADMATTQAYTGLLERKNDIGPDPSQLIGLSQGLGQYGGTPIEQGAPLANSGGTSMASSYFPQQQQPAQQQNPYAPGGIVNDSGFSVSGKRQAHGGFTDLNGNPMQNPTKQYYQNPNLNPYGYPIDPGFSVSGSTPNYTQGYGVETNRGFLGYDTAQSPTISNGLATPWNSPMDPTLAQRNQAAAQAYGASLGFGTPAIGGTGALTPQPTLMPTAINNQMTSMDVERLKARQTYAGV